MKFTFIYYKIIFVQYVNIVSHRLEVEANNSLYTSSSLPADASFKDKTVMW